jgi:hypothetical protein
VFDNEAGLLREVATSRVVARILEGVNDVAVGLGLSFSLPFFMASITRWNICIVLMPCFSSSGPV